MRDTVMEKRCPRCQEPIAPDAAEGLCTRCLLSTAVAATDGPAPMRGPVEAPSRERLAAAFPQLEILELIGVGGMGAVFKARQPRLDRVVALKILPEALGRDAAFSERFLREARVLARLSHPHIVAVHDFGESGGFFYLLMECVDGVNLRQAMKQGRFTPAQALALVPQVCEALQFAHERGVMHRDIKPENILLDARGTAKLADFGIAKLLGNGGPDPCLTVTGAAVGTPQYMAPEQIERPADVDHRADIYSLGVVFYEMLTGELPIGRFGAPSSKTPLDARVDEIVMRALAKERELRQQSAQEVRTEVEGVARRPDLARGGEAVASKADPVPRPLWGTSWRYQRGVFAGVSMLAVLLVVTQGGTLQWIGEHFVSALSAWDEDWVLASAWAALLGFAWFVQWVARKGQDLWSAFQPLPSAGTDPRHWIRPPLAWLTMGILVTGWMIHGLSAVVQVLSQVRMLSHGAFRLPHLLPEVMVTGYPLLLVVAAVFWTAREARRRGVEPVTPMAAWCLRLTMTILVLTVAIEGITAATRASRLVVSSLAATTLPFCVACWTANRRWRALALVLCVAGGAMALLGAGSMVVYAQGNGWGMTTPQMPPGVKIMGEIPTFHPVLMLVAQLGAALFHVAMGLALLRPEVRQAFGLPPGRARTVEGSGATAGQVGV